jgi:hypothetical protein
VFEINLILEINRGRRTRLEDGVTIVEAFVSIIFLNVKICQTVLFFIFYRTLQ